jgi:hypothetical protein
LAGAAAPSSAASGFGGAAGLPLSNSATTSTAGAAPAPPAAPGAAAPGAAVFGAAVFDSADFVEPLNGANHTPVICTRDCRLETLFTEPKFRHGCVVRKICSTAADARDAALSATFPCATFEPAGAAVT